MTFSNADRFCLAISIRCRHQTRMRISFGWLLQQQTGFLSNRHLLRMQLWKCRSNIAKHAIFGGPLEGITVEFVITVSKITTITAFGSIIALAAVITVISSHLSLLQH